VPALFGLAECLTAGEKYDEARELLERAAELVPEAPEVWNNLGEALGRLGKTADAIKRFDRAIAANEKFAPAWFGKARVLLNAGKKKDGKAAAKRYLALADPNDPMAVTLRKLIEES